MSNVPKVRAGDSILEAFTHKAFNAFADAANGGHAPPSGRDAEWSDLYGYRIKIQNDTGQDLDRFAVVGLGPPRFYSGSRSGVSFWSFLNQPTLHGQTPDEDDHRGKPAILLESIKKGKVGDALVMGVVPCQVDIQDVEHKWADINDGSTVSLKSFECGSVKILSNPSQTGVQWCLVQLVFDPCCMTLAEATLTSAMCPDAETGSVENIKLLPDLEDADPSSATAQNHYSCAGMAGDNVFLYRRWNGSDDYEWVIAQVQHHDVPDLPVDVYWDAGTGCLMKKVHHAAIMWCDEEREEEIVCFDPCPTE